MSRHALNSPAAMSAEPSLHPPEPKQDEPETPQSILAECDRLFWTLPEGVTKQLIGSILTILETQYRK